MSGEETFLESFVEHISDLPNDIRRNLDLVKDLDKSSSDIIRRLRAAEEAYVQRAEQTVLNLNLPTRKRKRGVRDEGEKSSHDSDDEEDAHPSEDVVKNFSGEDGGGDDIIIPPTDELRGHIMKPVELEMIARLRREAMQQSEEKVVVAEQTYAIVDETVKRLDADLSKFEA